MTVGGFGIWNLGFLWSLELGISAAALLDPSGDSTISSAHVESADRHSDMHKEFTARSLIIGMIGLALAAPN
jgi:hypothetical protein